MKNKFGTLALLTSVLASTMLGCSGWPHGRGSTSQQWEGTGDIPDYGKQASETEYRAVLLSNGMVLFGKLHGLGTAFPVMTDVYYVQTVEDPATKKPTTVLIKRGKEWHAPDRTVLNPRQIILIEPVTSGSKVMHLILESGNEK
jgi:hypothetical protein